MACVRERRGRWVVDYRDPATGQRRWESYRYKPQAERRLDRIRASLAAGQTLSAPTFSAWWPKYISLCPANAPSTLARKKEIARLHLIPAFGETLLSRITVAMVEDYRTARLSGGALTRSTVNREVGILRHALKTARRIEIPAEVPDVSALPEPRPRARFLRPETLRAYLAACPAWFRPLPAVLALTGLRLGEALGIRGDDLRGETLLVRRFKPRRTETVPLSPLAGAILEGLRTRYGTEQLFRNDSGGDLKVDWIRLRHVRVCRKIGIRFRLHDLRHTFGSYLAMDGIDSRLIGVLLGHSQPATTARYTHLALAPLARAVACLPNALGIETLFGNPPDGSKTVAVPLLSEEEANTSL